MKFGVNEDVNRVAANKVKIIREPTTTQKEEDPDIPQTPNEGVRESLVEKKNPVNVLPALGGAIAFGFLIAKYVI